MCNNKNEKLPHFELSNAYAHMYSAICTKSMVCYII